MRWCRVDRPLRTSSAVAPGGRTTIRILIFNWKDLAHPLAGGAEVFTEELARALVTRGHSVTLFAASIPGKRAHERVEGVEIVRAGGRVGVYREARRFWARQGRIAAYDVVIDEINTRPFMTPRWVRGTPIVALIHQLAREIWFYETPFPVALVGRYVLEPRWLRAYRDVSALTVSASSAESLRRYHGWRNVAVVPEGWTPHPMPDVAREERPTMVFLARMVGMKRPAHAIEAFEHLARQVPSAQLWMIGDGPLLARLRVESPPGVQFLGRISREEVLARLAAAHVLVATSVREGWGLNVNEAAACGTPCIGYTAPGLVDSIPASGGFVVEPRADALGDALLEFFAGRRVLRPTVAAVPWSEVATAVERHLDHAVAR